MEVKGLNRVDLADSIYAQLLQDESFAILRWKRSFNSLKLENTLDETLDVLTCVYNAEAYIENAINSILYQSYDNIHLVIVADPCTDNTIQIIKKCQDELGRITLIENKEHMGIISCFNIGLKHCNNKFIARMDLDDLIHPLRFEKQMNYLRQHPEVDVISCFMHIFNEKKEIKEICYRDDFDLQKITLLFFSPLSHAGSIFRANVIQEAGYREGYTYAEDFDLWYRIMDKYRTAVLPEYLYLYRTHSNQVTNPKHYQIHKKSFELIMPNIFKSIGVTFDSSDVEFHIDYFLFNRKLDSKNEWIKFHIWLIKLVIANRKSGYLNSSKFINFLYINYWQTEFLKFKNQLNLTQIIEQNYSLMNEASFIEKCKEIIKYILRK